MGKLTGHTPRFIQTHELWTRDVDPRTQIRLDPAQLTDSLVCVSMSNEIRRTIANLTKVGTVLTS